MQGVAPDENNIKYKGVKNMKTKKLFSYFLASALLMSVFCAAPAQAATNSVNFDGAGYNLADEMWTVTKDGADGVFGTDAALVEAENDVTPHSGTKMIKVTGEAGKTVELKKVFEVEPGKNYAASVWMYLKGFTDDPADDADGAKLYVKDEEGNLMSRKYGSKKIPFPGQTSETGYFVANKTAWRKMYVYVHGADANRDSVEMTLSLKGAGAVYFDDILLEEAPLIPNGDFEGLTSDFVPAVWVPSTTASEAVTFTDRDTIPEYTEENKTTYPWKGFGYSFLGTEAGKDGQHLVIAENQKKVQIFPILLEKNVKYKLTLDYQSVHTAKCARLLINHKLHSDTDPFMQGNKIGTATSSSNYSRLPDGGGQWVNKFEYYFTMHEMATITTNAYIALQNHTNNMFKIDNVKLERLEDVPTVSITKEGETTEQAFSGGDTVKVSFVDAYVPLTRKMSQQSATGTTNTAYIYSGEENTMLVAAYTKENGVKKLVECKVVTGKAESSTMMYDVTNAFLPTPDLSAYPAPTSKWCHGEAPLKLETDITFGQKDDGKEYEIEAFVLGKNLQPMYTTDELAYN